MIQQQPQRPRANQFPDQEPIRYGDVFDVSGELASKPVAPRDAATMQAAENKVLGQTQRGGPASVVQSAATHNLRAGQVGHNQATNIARDDCVTVSDATIEGNRVVTEAVGGQVVAQYAHPMVPVTTPAALDRNAITIGEALEASALSAGYKPVDESDAAAIQAAEMRATRRNEVIPGGVAATAQSAATRNQGTMCNDDKTKLSHVLADASANLPVDKPVTREDAEGVIAAELRNNPNMRTTIRGVAASIAAAARFNQYK